VLSTPAFSAFAATSVSLADPEGASVLLAAVSWLQHALLGTVAEAVAVTAIAFVGFSMLSGRIGVRHGLTVVIGCFIIFGASSIAIGIRSFAGGDDGEWRAPQAVPEVPALPQPPPRASAGNDPYAGASIPAR
jgi:type IV secretory pathway VirB2 component (pilin)